MKGENIFSPFLFYVRIQDSAQLALSSINQDLFLYLEFAQNKGITKIGIEVLKDDQRTN